MCEWVGDHSIIISLYTSSFHFFLHFILFSAPTRFPPYPFHRPVYHDTTLDPFLFSPSLIVSPPLLSLPLPTSPTTHLTPYPFSHPPLSLSLSPPLSLSPSLHPPLSLPPPSLPPSLRSVLVMCLFWLWPTNRISSTPYHPLRFVRPFVLHAHTLENNQ